MVKVPVNGFQIFFEGGELVAISEGKTAKGKWKLSSDNKTLTLKSGLISIKFQIDYFDEKKRIMTNKQVGTIEYEKVAQ